MKTHTKSKFLAAIYCCLFFSISFISATAYSNTLVGNDEGLFVLSDFSELQLWDEAPVEKIVNSNGWFFLTQNGILYSKDLSTFEYRNNGLPQNLIKHFDGETTSFTNKTELLKDLEVHPTNPDILVTLTRDQVFITYDAGLTWQSFGFSAQTNGAKAVAVCTLPNDDGTEDLTVFLSHSIYSLSYKRVKKDTKWTDMRTGLDTIDTLSNPDEIADILTTPSGDVYLTQTFIPRLYKLNWKQKSLQLLAKGKEPQDTWDSLAMLNNTIIFMTPAGLRLFNLTNATVTEPTDKNLVTGFSRICNLDQISHCTWLPPSVTHTEKGLSLSELWMTHPQKIESNYADKIANHHSVFIPPTEKMDQEGIDKYMKVLTDNNLDSIVINMKDDYGLLRYNSTDSKVLEKAYVSSYAIDLDTFIPQFKEKDIYLIARIVVFKDKNLWKYSNGKYAIKDSTTGNPWMGIRNTTEDEETGEIITNYYDEQWVDPYSQDVWAYNVAIAQELINKGFDEIQFDYIRFPTDGYNLNKADFTFQDSGMDKESALISFLSYARDNIDAPIAIDIYGANGWYRTGARTGQDVEILSSYVDVICPMFYPSHFEQIFLAYEPAIERPYRVYYYGTYRNSIISRNKALIRPWIQAFYLNCSYDKLYYDDNGDYVRREMFGVRDSTQTGYMFWNNSGRYTDLTPRPSIDEEYPWQSYEAAPEYRKPSLSKGE